MAAILQDTLSRRSRVVRRSFQLESLCKTSRLRGYVLRGVFSVCLSVNRLTQKLLTNFDEMFGKGAVYNWQELVRFWW